MKARQKGFTLAELLIALAILGVIATFTIPKILQNGTSGQNKAIAKEAASMVAGAFSAYQLNNTISSSTVASALTPFMNYVAVDTSTNYAGSAGTKLETCSATLACLKLHNGGILQYDTGQSFGANTTASIHFNIDPDGTGTQGRASFVLYKNGRLTTGENAPVASTDSAGATLDLEATDPGYIENWD